MQAPFPVFAGFIETGFEQRFQGILRRAWHQRSWHVIVAEPGSGKSMGICDFVAASRREQSPVGGRHFPILAVTAPKNDPKEQGLGNYIMVAMNLPITGRWSEKKCALLQLLKIYGVECLIIDDAHDLSMQHLILLKEITDQLRLPPFDRPLGLCLVTAGRGAAMPLKDIFDQPETMWMQFRRRLDRVQPYCRIANHTQEEVRDILGALESVYQPYFSALNLRQWTGTLYSWLTHPLLDPQRTGRANMDNLVKLVTTALEWTYAQGEADVTAQTLEAASQLLLLQRESVQVIDAPGAHPSTQENLSTQPPVPRTRRRGSSTLK
ncbi:MAG: TniB family NTP-binding protein [Blastocatellia bacterium]|nr:TniB family NTP-binding protein [Blastocatellia bacterium]